MLNKVKKNAQKYPGNDYKIKEQVNISKEKSRIHKEF